MKCYYDRQSLLDAPDTAPVPEEGEVKCNSPVTLGESYLM